MTYEIHLRGLVELIVDQAEQHVAGLPPEDQQRVFALVIEQLEMLRTGGSHQAGERHGEG